jgi:hypothetical protein
MQQNKYEMNRVEWKISGTYYANKLDAQARGNPLKDGTIVWPCFWFAHPET